MKEQNHCNGQVNFNQTGRYVTEQTYKLTQKIHLNYYSSLLFVFSYVIKFFFFLNCEAWNLFFYE